MDALGEAKDPDWTLSGTHDDADDQLPDDGWPPQDMLPGVVDRPLLLGRSAAAVVFLSSILAYPTGLTLRLELRVRPGSDWLYGPRGQEVWQEAQRPGRLAWGFAFSNGRQVSSTDRPSSPVPATPPPHRLEPRGGSGTEDSVQMDHWLWPLPPPGELTVFCTWPDRDIPTTRQTLASALFLDAADRAVPLWP